MASKMIKHICAVCGGEVILDECNVCDVCGWEEDAVQEDDPDYSGGANRESLNDYKAAWEKRNA